MSGHRRPAAPVSVRRRHAPLRSLLGLALLMPGCLFNAAPPPRYFAPPSALFADGDPPANPSAQVRRVRLRHIRAAAYLGEQIVWRGSDVERGLYEQRRWTEFPSRYLERAMARALDRTPGVDRIASGRAATLDLELISFDEILAPQHAAEVMVVAALRDTEHRTVFDRIFVAQRPIPDADPASAARSMGAALDDVVQQIAEAVARWR